ncbi:MAG: dockerin type I repeat-containing protein, partial [Oscillospiraceae bacterium]|nr:dockerin type I repeat-containing protein [Oscillospiraceae bacterium]
YAYYSAKTADQEKRSWSDCYQKEMGDICLHVYTEYEGETVPTLPGDMNRDGVVNAVDLSLLKQMLLGSERTDTDRKVADWNEDTKIDVEDAKGIVDFLLQRES